VKEHTVSDANKDIVHRWGDEMINHGRLDVADQVCSSGLAHEAKERVAPFRASFPDVTMRTVTLLAEGDQVVG
jgi:hypothetical protein